MALYALVIFLLLLRKEVSAAAAPLRAHVHVDPPDLPIAISDMRSNSYYGFVILLDMANSTTKSALTRQATFFIPSDQQLSESTISPDRLDEFILRHTIPEPLVLDELSHVPSGTLIPTFIKSRLLRISSRGRHVFVNNAQIVAPNLCSSASIKCHGINTIIVSRRNHMDSASGTD